jgi:hypothetical protein
MRKVLKPKGFWVKCEEKDQIAIIAETIVSLIKNYSKNPHMIIYYVSIKFKGDFCVFRFNHMASEKVRTEFEIKFSTKNERLKLAFWEKEQRTFALANITKDEVFHLEYIGRLKKFLVAEKSAEELFSEYFILD